MDKDDLILTLAEAVGRSYIDWGDSFSDTCIHCGEYLDDNYRGHKSDCVVLLAQKIMKQNDNKENNND